MSLTQSSEESSPFLKKVEENGMYYNINIKEKTAFLINGLNYNNEIPRSIENMGQEYLVTEILKCAMFSWFTSYSCSEDSELRTINENAFISDVSGLSIPSCVTSIYDILPSLTDIIILPNKEENIKYYNNKFIIGKSEPKSDIFDVLILARRDIQTAIIPPFIKQFSSIAFKNCKKISNLVIPSNSQLNFFSQINFLSNLIISKERPKNRKRMKNSFIDIYSHEEEKENIKFFDDKFIIGKSDQNSEKFNVLLFASRDIKEAIIPSFIEIIAKGCFANCTELHRVKVLEDSQLKIIESDAFSDSTICELVIKSNVELKNGWSNGIKELNCIKMFQIKEEKMKSEHKNSNNNHNHKDIEFYLKNDENMKYKYYCYNDDDDENMKYKHYLYSDDDNNDDNDEINDIDNCPDKYDILEFFDNRYIIRKSYLERFEFDSLFYACRNITQLTISPSIRLISPHALENCNELEKVIFPYNSKLEIIGEYSFASSSINEIFLPYHLTKICEGAFAFCEQLKTVEFCEYSELKIIGPRAFQSTEIESISFPPHLTKICEGAFDECVKLSTIEIPENSELQIIEDCVFNDTLITEFTIPDKITSISPSIFGCCDKIEHVTILSKMIDQSIFSESSVESITVPSDIILKGKWCKGTKKLIKINIIRKKEVNIKYYDDEYIIGKSDPKSDKFDVLLFVHRDIENATIPSFIEQISPYAFHECNNITTIEIPPQLRKICNSAFRSCSKLEEIVFSQNSELEIIESKAFYDCCCITKITFPPHLKKICCSAFRSCSKLEEIEFPRNSELEIIEEYGFAYCPIKTLKIPSQLTYLYDCAFYHCEKLEEIEIQPDSKLQFIGRQTFYNSLIKSVTIPSHVTFIGKEAFDECDKLLNVEFQENSEIQTISRNAFTNKNIDTLSIPSNIVEIRGNFFGELINLKNIKILQNNQNNISFFNNKFIIGKSNINNDVFDILYFAIHDIKYALIPSFIKCIKSKAFYSSHKLKRVDFLDNSELELIKSDAFIDSSLEEIHFPPHLKCISSKSFYYLRLKKVVFPENSELQVIDISVFSQNPFVSLSIPKSVKVIRKNAFSGCNQLKIIEFNENTKIDSIGIDVFQGCFNALMMVPQKIKIINLY